MIRTGSILRHQMHAGLWRGWHAPGLKSGNGLSLVIRSSALAGMAKRTVSIAYVHIYLCMYEHMKCTIQVSTRQKKLTTTLVKSSSVHF